nr:immunoglobulin heavy chain junction region [Macaca mulatta]
CARIASTSLGNRFDVW